MKNLRLTQDGLMGLLHEAIEHIRDPRQVSNNLRYDLQDIVLAAFSVFFMQCASFLEHQRQMQSYRGRSNAQTLFGLNKLPTTPQVRNVLDKISSALFNGVFLGVFRALKVGGFLKSYEVLKGNFLVALDGTQYFSSHQIHCEQCNHRHHEDGTIDYYHQAVLPAIVAPGQGVALPLAPSMVEPQDGHNKQDCENAAAKRWINGHSEAFAGEAFTYLGDDLYSCQPICELIRSKGANFIFTCLPSSHVELYKWLEHLEKLGEIKHEREEYHRLRQHEVSEYRYVNQVPLRDEDPSLLVNWCEVTIKRMSDGKVLYHNAWVTLHHLEKEILASVVAAGRCRWKIENENNNTLKTKGYHLEHNFGHGQQHLSSTLLVLNLIAFLFHAVLQLVDEKYQLIRKKRGPRKGFFEDLRSLTKFFLFENWQALIDFMISGQLPVQTMNSS
jgi:hypothetical protein